MPNPRDLGVRILFVASLHHPQPSTRAGPNSYFSDPAHIPSSQTEHFWVKSLTKMGHACAVFWRTAGAWPWAGTRPLRMTERLTLGRALHAAATAIPAVNPDIRIRNRRLLRCAREFQPDVILLVGGNEVVLPETLAALKRRHAAVIANACSDSPVVFSKPIERAAAKIYDLVVTNDLCHAIEWRELGAPRAEVLPLSAVDPSFHRAYGLSELEAARYRCEIGFVGTLVPARLYAKRIAALEALRPFHLAIWSVHEVPASLQSAYRGPALGEEVMKAICGSTMVVNPNGDFMRFGGNQRLFEACGAGTFQIAEDCPAVRRWFTTGTHMAAYTTVGELPGMVSHYLTHDDERRRIAAAGQKHVYAHHTFDHRMERLIQWVEQAREGQVLSSGTESAP